MNDRKILDTRLAKLFGRFLRNTRGSTAIEFAIVAWPFLMLVIGIMYLALTLFADFALQTLVNQAARQVQIGNLKTMQDFKSAICNDSASFFSCAKVRAQAFPVTAGKTFSTNCFSATGTAPSSCFDPGAGGGPGVTPSMMMVRATYPWPLTLVMENPATTYTLVATVVFRNEPY